MKTLKITLFALLVALAGTCYAQGATPSYCTTTAPCWAIALNNGTDVSATVVTNGAGIETSGPATASIYLCTVSGTQTCAPPASLPATGWVLQATNNGQSLTQTGSTGTFYAPAVYGSTVAVGVTLTFTGALSSNTASPAAFSAQATFPAVPGATPVAPVSVAATPAT
jgi:hypothetical protein